MSLSPVANLLLPQNQLIRRRGIRVSTLKLCLSMFNDQSTSRSMKPYPFFSVEQIICLTFFSFILLSRANLNAQSPVNFSGAWEFDRAGSTLVKADPVFEGTEILEIKQNSRTISFAETYIRKGSEDFKTLTDVYKHNGKVYTRKDKIGTSKKSAKWSEDRTALIITNLDRQTLEGVLSDFLMIDTYKLSDDRLILTIERYRKNQVTGETTSILIYHKKTSI